MNKIKRFTYWIEVAALGIIMGLVIQGVRAWTEPSAAPPEGNLGAPVNTGSLAQVKQGALGLFSNNRDATTGVTINPDALGLLVQGKIVADKFCLPDGTCLSNGGGSTNMATFPNPGTNSWTVPNGVTQIVVEARAGGGGGGGGSPSWNATAGYGGAGGGGGGGAYARGQYSVTPGSTIQIEVGKGGIGGPGGTFLSTRKNTNDTQPSNVNVGETGGSTKIGSFMTLNGGTGGNGGIPSWGGTACNAGGSGPWLLGNGGFGGHGGIATGSTNLFSFNGTDGIQGGDPCTSLQMSGGSGGSQGGGKGGASSSGATGSVGDDGQPGFVVISY